MKKIDKRRNISSLIYRFISREIGMCRDRVDCVILLVCVASPFVHIRHLADSAFFSCFSFFASAMFYLRAVSLCRSKRDLIISPRSAPLAIFFSLFLHFVNVWLHYVVDFSTYKNALNLKKIER